MTGIAVVVLVGAVFGAWRWYGGSQSAQEVSAPADWQMYTSETMNLSIAYDSKLTKHSDSASDVRFSMWGPTQKGQTEMYDGIIFSMRTFPTPSGTDAYIKSQEQMFKDVGTITKPLSDEILAGESVKRIQVSALGDFDIIYIPRSDTTMLEISFMTPDPTNAGFRAIVDTMLSTLRLK